MHKSCLIKYHMWSQMVNTSSLSSQDGLWLAMWIMVETRNLSDWEQDPWDPPSNVGSPWPIHGLWMIPKSKYYGRPPVRLKHKYLRIEMQLEYRRFTSTDFTLCYVPKRHWPSTSGSGRVLSSCSWLWAVVTPVSKPEKISNPIRRGQPIRCRVMECPTAYSK